jgi:ribose transport system substrate-binding protein
VTLVASREPMLASSIARWVTAPLLASIALGCRPKPAPSESARAGTPQQPWVIGMSQCNLGEPWRVQMNADIAQAAAQHPNLRVVFKDAQNDSLVQRAQVEELASQGIHLLIVSPKEAAPLTRPVAEVYAKKIPVIVLDRAVEGDKFTSFIGADNVKIGRAAGAWTSSALGGRGKIVELEGLMTSTPGQDRHAGFHAGLAEADARSTEVVFTADMQWLEPNARREMESALASQRRIDLVYAHNDPGAHGAYLAAKAAGREKEMKFVEQGILDATFLYPTGGTEAIDLALRILRGEKVEKKIVLGTRLYTKSNLARGGEEIR